MSEEEIINRLKLLGDQKNVINKKNKFGIVSSNALGIYMKDLNLLSKTIGKNSELAISLFESDYYEAKLLAGKIFKPKDLTMYLVRLWTQEFNNREICDTLSMGVYSKSTVAENIILEYSTKQTEYEKRAAFATLVSFCMADKKAPNAEFLKYLPILESSAVDDRIYVKKAVNWAIRSIGKCNIDLKIQVIAFCKELLLQQNTTTKWIAKDTLKELQDKNVRISDYPRSVYRI